jgi:hypothetical protein
MNPRKHALAARSVSLLHRTFDNLVEQFFFVSAFDDFALTGQGDWCAKLVPALRCGNVRIRRRNRLQ